MTTKYVKKKWTVIAKFKIHYIKVCDTYIFEFPATVGTSAIIIMVPDGTVKSYTYIEIPRSGCQDLIKFCTS